MDMSEETRLREEVDYFREAYKGCAENNREHIAQRNTWAARATAAESALAEAKRDAARARASNLENSLALAEARGALREARAEAVALVDNAPMGSDPHGPLRTAERALHHIDAALARAGEQEAPPAAPAGEPASSGQEVVVDDKPVAVRCDCGRFDLTRMRLSRINCNGWHEPHGCGEKALAVTAVPAWIDTRRYTGEFPSYSATINAGVGVGLILVPRSGSARWSDTYEVEADWRVVCRGVGLDERLGAYDLWRAKAEAITRVFERVRYLHNAFFPSPTPPPGEQGKGGGEGLECGACGGSGAVYETHDVGVTERIGCEECNATGYLAPAQPAEHPASGGEEKP